MINRIYLLLFTLFFFQQCASIRQPTGGDKDIAPPKVLMVSPDSGALNVQTDKIFIQFDEYVVIRNLNAQLLVSPPLEKPISYFLKGKKLIIELNQDLLPNTTYQFNFGESIVDNNEGNKLTNFNLVFSTGSFLDSSVLNGHIADLLTNKPVSGCLVMLYDDYSDSSVLKSRPLYVTRTNDSGEYTFTHLKHGAYHLVALTDKNGNYKLDIDEQVQYYPQSPLTPDNQYINQSVVTWRPDLSLKLKDQSNLGPGIFRLVFNKPLTPHQNVDLHINYSDHYKIPMIPQRYSPSRDSFYFFLSNYTDTTAIEGFCLVNQDTFNILIKPKYFKPGRQVSISQKLQMAKPGSEGIVFKYSRPIIDLSQTRCTLLKDSVPVNDFDIIPTEDPFEFKILHNFDGNAKYELVTRDSFITDFYNFPSVLDTVKMRIQSPDNLGNLSIKVLRKDTIQAPVYFSLILSKNNIQETRIDKTGELDIEYVNINPGQYSFTYYYDLNGNGQWDPGNILTREQPEPYFSSSVHTEIRSKWSVEDVTITIE